MHDPNCLRPFEPGDEESAKWCGFSPSDPILLEQKLTAGEPTAAMTEDSASDPQNVSKESSPAAQALGGTDDSTTQQSQPPGADESGTSPSGVFGTVATVISEGEMEAAKTTEEQQQHNESSQQQINSREEEEYDSEVTNEEAAVANLIDPPTSSDEATSEETGREEEEDPNAPGGGIDVPEADEETTTTTVSGDVNASLGNATGPAVDNPDGAFVAPNVSEAATAMEPTVSPPNIVPPIVKESEQSGKTEDAPPPPTTTVVPEAAEPTQIPPTPQSAAEISTEEQQGQHRSDEEKSRDHNDDDEEVKDNEAAFVNRGLATWEQTRRQWLRRQCGSGSGDGGAFSGEDTRASESSRAVATPLDVDEIIDIIFTSPKQIREEGGPRQFPQHVPLPQMIDILVDLW